MPRAMTPDDLLTPSQRRKRLYNQRYRQKRHSIPYSEQKISLVENPHPSSSGEIRMKSDPPSNVISFPHNYTNQLEVDNDYNWLKNGRDFFSQSRSEKVKQETSLKQTLEDLRREVSFLRNENKLLKECSRTKISLFSKAAILLIKNGIYKTCSFLRLSLSFSFFMTSVIILAAFLIWQGEEILAITGNKGSLWFAAGLEFSSLLAAALSGLSAKRLGKAVGFSFVLALTAVMGLFVISGIEKRSLTESSQYQRAQQQRELLISQIQDMRNEQNSLPENYKTRKLQLQEKVEQSTKELAVLNQQLNQIALAPQVNPIETLANIISRILVMLLEAWVVHLGFSQWRCRKNNAIL